MNKKENGVTLVALTVMIILMLIIAGITIYNGKESIKQAKLEELRTNMLLIEAKAKECVEDANFKIGINETDTEKIANVRKEVYEGIGLVAVTDTQKTIPSLPSGISSKETLYWVTEETLKNWGLNHIKLDEDEAYFVDFNEKNVTVEIYNNMGYNGKYSLTDINQIDE